MAVADLRALGFTLAAQMSFEGRQDRGSSSSLDRKTVSRTTQPAILPLPESTAQTDQWSERMSDNAGRPDVSRCRARMAELLAETVATTRKLEEKMAVDGDWSEAAAEIDFDADPAAMLRFQGALLLRKARLHTLAVLRANESSNLHSLAVQMRPVLECAGQVVSMFWTAFIAPDWLMSREKAHETLATRLNADFYQTFRNRTKGQISAVDLRGMAAEADAVAAASFGAPPLREQKTWSFRQSDKVASLEGGHEWYAYLSKHFGHGRGVDWKGLSSRGGVVSIDRVEDEFAFLGLMSYLAQQVAAMNAHAALCPFAGDAGDRWERWVEPALAQQRDVRESSNAMVAAARAVVMGGSDGNAPAG